MDGFETSGDPEDLEANTAESASVIIAAFENSHAAERAVITYFKEGVAP